MNEKDIAERIAKLRMQKGVSARDMSLSLGQNPGYINNIETGKTRPSIGGLLYICDYFRIEPADFFQTDTEAPEALRQLMPLLRRLNQKQLEHIQAIVEDIIKP